MCVILERSRLLDKQRFGIGPQVLLSASFAGSIFGYFIALLVEVFLGV